VKKTEEQTKQPTVFIPLNEAVSIISIQSQTEICKKDFDLIIETGLLPTYERNGESYVINSDLNLLKGHLQAKKQTQNELTKKYALLAPSIIELSSHSHIISCTYDQKKHPAVGSALKNLLEYCNTTPAIANPGGEQCISYFDGSKLITKSQAVADFSKRQLKLATEHDGSEQGKFTKSASYMGSKKPLSGFLVEALQSILSPKSIVVDLMCGSGAASAAFCNHWETIASDAQLFCRNLAKIQGRGYEVKRARQLLTQILPIAKDHFSDLCNFFPEAIKNEAELFSSDLSPALQETYSKLCDSFPRLSTGGNWNNWNPICEVAFRKYNNTLAPYCLFTAYFTNVYFGLRQCVEIDSLRYAINQLQENTEKEWAMSALITTVSAVGTTYGGHFAQPKFKDIDKISLPGFFSLLEKRALSVSHEFSIRLLNLAEISQNKKHSVHTLKGPWEKALKELDQQIKDNKDILIYLDAPYTREAYSRYYHILETLCDYNYPSCTGNGLIPSPSERFTSDFSTRNIDRLNTLFVQMITEILKNDWKCAWSYSNTAAGDIINIIDRVADKTKCEIKSYTVPATHKSHGGAKPKSVKEYLIIFQPKQ
jgi:adenine-specific DNA methylase